MTPAILADLLQIVAVLAIVGTATLATSLWWALVGGTQPAPARAAAPVQTRAPF